MTPPRRPWLSGLLVVGIAALLWVLLALGFWQLDRLQQRRALNDRIVAQLAQAPLDLNQTPLPDLPEYQRVRLRGTYDFAQEIVLRNRSHLGAPGVRVLTPLRLSGAGVAVLVDRGWLPYEQAAPAERAAYQWPMGEVTVEGIVRPQQQRAYGFLPADPPLSAAQPRVDAWFRVDVDQIQAQVPYALLPYYVEAEAGADPRRLPLSGYAVDLTEGPHLGYAIQWFAFAAILLGGSLALWWQRRTGRSRRV